MGRLLERLQDPARSGLYRTPRPDEILDATRGSRLRLARVRLEAPSGKEVLLAQLARALEFPQWFGGNWDALEDCLTDLSWSDAAGWVLVIEGTEALAPDDAGVFRDVLGVAADWWRERGRPFFAIFVGGAPALPELFRAKR
jgi:hypothetical protein